MATARIREPLNPTRLKKGIQAAIGVESDNIWREKIESYLMQGEFMKILIEEKNDITWKAYLWGVPRGVARFAVNSCLVFN